MWLINIETLNLESFLTEERPPYAILSHTWGAKEPTFSDFSKSPELGTTDSKIINTCLLARLQGLRYVWIDTVCIDKSSSAELSEAINSMYKWYQDAAVCFVYLEDAAEEQSIDEILRDCRWRKRGWTLQELIAPKEVCFFDLKWRPLGTKQGLLKELNQYTGIPITLLGGTHSLGYFEAASKMAWAAERSTSRVEDLAYCLLGIFDINMPLLYGEGDKAFRRLQEEILKITPDVSLLLWQGFTNDGLDLRKSTQDFQIDDEETWTAPRCSVFFGDDLPPSESRFLPVLAQSPKDFTLASGKLAAAIDESVEVVMNQLSLSIYNDGEKIQVRESGHAFKSDKMLYWFDVRNLLSGAQHPRWLPLRKIAPGVFGVEDRRYFMSPEHSFLSRSFMSKMSLMLRPGVHTIKRASDARQGGIRVPDFLLPGYYIYGVRPQSHWDPTDRILFPEPRGSGSSPVFAIDIQNRDSQNHQQFMILLEPQWNRNTVCRIATVTQAKQYVPIEEASLSIYNDVFGTYRDRGVAWDLFVTRWPEVLKWESTSYVKTGAGSRQWQKISVNLRPAQMVSFGNMIEVFDLTVQPCQVKNTPTV